MVKQTVEESFQENLSVRQPKAFTLKTICDPFSKNPFRRKRPYECPARPWPHLQKAGGLRVRIWGIVIGFRARYMVWG